MTSIVDLLSFFGHRGIMRKSFILFLFFVLTISCHVSERSLGLSPIPFVKGSIFTTSSGTTNWVYIPNSYDSTHKTPMPLFVWLHGCGGRGQYDIDMVSPGGTTQTWISLAVGGREGSCWSTLEIDGPKVLAAINDIKSHFNVDSRRVVLGGYSSGGDIGYALAFQKADLFSGVIFENTGPSSEALTLAPKAVWKLNIAHIAHTSDTTYPISSIRTKMTTLKNLGFPVVLTERPGTHWDNDGANFGTKYDLVNIGLPYLKKGWASPAPVCSYSYSAWAECQSISIQTRTVVSSAPLGCEGVPTLQQACTYVPPVCSQFSYSGWSECASTGKQTRTVTASGPTGCVGGIPGTEQSCIYVKPDQDKDGILNAYDACPAIAGIKTSFANTNGCPALSLSFVKSADWGTGYCYKLYMKNMNTMNMKWLSVSVQLGDSKLRGTGAVWGGVFANPTATGTIDVAPVAWTSPVKAGMKIETIGFCANYGPTKSAPVVVNVVY